MTHLSDESTHVRIAIIGSGFAGIGTAIRLLQRSIHDFVILERAAALGGTWRDNSYPGCACDVPSHLYSLSFALNPEWSRTFSPQREIWEYLRRIAKEQGVLPHVRYQHEVLGAEWDREAQRWQIETTQGGYSASMLVVAAGPLSDPAVPALPGLASFEGTTFHSARWDHNYDLTGKRVAVIGTGASAIQFVPQIQPTVAALHLFQRTAPWILPREDRAIDEWERRLYRRSPTLQRLMRGWQYVGREMLFFPFRHLGVARLVEHMALRHLDATITDPALRSKLVPNYRIGCKRILVSDDYLPSLTRPNVEVVSAGITEIRPQAIRSGDGVERPTDAIILATGFRPTDPPLAPHVRGRDGRSLAECWAGSPTAYVGMTMSTFPNLFFLLGPNTGLGHTSVLIMIEAQIEHLMRAIDLMERRGASTVEPRVEAKAAYVADIDRRMQGTVWTAGGCRSWYLDATGRNSSLWPDGTWSYRRRAARLDERDYITEAAPIVRLTPASARDTRVTVHPPFRT